MSASENSHARWLPAETGIALPLRSSAASPGDETNRTGVTGIEADESSGSDTVGATIGTAAPLAIGASTNGWVNTAGDDDWYAVSMVAGQSYTFSLIGGTLSDPYLEIFDSNGILVGFDDDFGSGVNATLRWTATTTGTYYINARAYEDATPTLSGSYTLSAATSAPASPLDSINYHFAMPTTSIAVWFAPSGFTNPRGDTATLTWSQADIDGVMAALATYSAITPLTFSVAASQGAANWIFSLGELSGNTLGYFSPNNTGYAFFDGLVAGFSAGLVPGGNSWVTIIHEAGHGLGMAHPHDNGSRNYGPDNSEVMQGVTDAFNSYGTFNMNQGVFTTMSYNDGWNTSGFGATPSNTTGGQSTPMALDVAFMQQLYGVNTSNGAGNTVYTLALASSSYRSIWDVDGLDTISYAGAGNATIDLRAASLLNEVGGGGYVSFVFGVHGGFTIANGVIIESAISGTGDDTLIGNSANNTLSGGSGTDTLSGNGGNDTLNGGAGNDLINGGDGSDTASFADAGSGVTANIANGASSGGAGSDTLVSIENLLGSIHADALVGDGGANSLDGGAGADAMTGGLGDDLYIVDNSGDAITELANEGFDQVFGSVNYTLAANVEMLTLTGAAFIGTGNDTANQIVGNDVYNELYGLGGNDRLIGLGGGDILDGGAGSDELIGGLGDDVYVVDSASDAITELSGEGFDQVFSSVSYTLSANVDMLTLTGSAFSGVGNATGNQISGTGVYNELYGLDGNDRLIGLGGGDILDGGAGSDELIGGTGDDVYVVDSAGDTITELVGEGFDQVFSSVSHTLAANVDMLTLTASGFSGAGNAAGNQIVGTDVYNELYGLAGNDRLIGLGGGDILDGGADSDEMIGGAGDDLYIVDSIGDSIIEVSGEGFDQVFSSVSFTLSANVDMLTLTGSGFSGSGNTTGNQIVGTNVYNELYGLDGNDRLIGLGGGDILDGGAGSDELIGGTGDDLYMVDSGGDSIIEVSGEGFDQVFSSVSYTLAANVDMLTLTGSAFIGAGNATGNQIVGTNVYNEMYGLDGNDRLIGLGGGDILDGGAGGDELIGGAGDDLYIVDSAGDAIIELTGEGFDQVLSSVSYTLAANVDMLTLTGSAFSGVGNATGNQIVGTNVYNELYGLGGNDRLIGLGGGDILDGGAGADELIGGTGDDLYIVDSSGDTITELSGEGFDQVLSSVSYTLAANVDMLTLTGSADINATGNSAANQIVGNSGANIITGGGGSDLLEGGSGADGFVFNTALPASGVATITDFSVVDDTIRLDRTIFTAINAGALDVNAFHIGSAAADASDRIIYNSATGALLYDADGTGGGAAVQFATLSVGLALTQDDFFGFGP